MVAALVIVTVELAVALLLACRAVRQWQRRAEVWEDAYRECHAQLSQLLNTTEEYLDATDSKLVRVWASQN